MWSPYGFLNQMGAVDIAGSGPVHLVGGASAFVAAIMLGPRLGRWDLQGDNFKTAHHFTKRAF